MSASSVNSTRILPLEIFENIIEELEGDDIALIACSTVSHLFRVLSQRRQFSIIRLSDSTPCREVQNMLLENHTIVPYIRELHVDGRTPWIAQQNSFAPLLQLLADTGSLRVFSSKVNVSWDEFPRPTKRAFLNLLVSPTIHTVSLFNTFTSTFPVELFALIPALKHLAFFGTSPGKPPKRISQPPLPPDASVTSRPRELDSLKIGGVQAPQLARFLTSPHTTLSVSQLRYLSIFGSGPRLLSAARDIMAAAQCTIISMTWNFRHDDKNPGHGLIDIQTVQRLRFLTFHVNLKTADHKWVIELLKRGGLSPHLEKLSISIDSENELGANCILYTALAQVDVGLGDIIAEKRYQRLTCIDTEVHVSTMPLPNVDDKEWYRTKVLGLLPLLNATGKLLLKVTLVPCR